jgi:hypothetical protein
LLGVLPRGSGGQQYRLRGDIQLRMVVENTPFIALRITIFDTVLE